MTAGGVPFVVTALALLLLLFPFFGVLFSELAAVLPVGLFAAGVLALHSAYDLTTRTGGLADPESLKLAVFLLVPMLLARSRCDLLAAVAVWLPFETGWLGDVWAWPPAGGSALNGVLALPFAACLFIGTRRLDGVGLPLRWSRADAVRAGVSLVAFSAVAVPFGLWTGFMELHPRLDPGRLAGIPLALFFFVGVPEEFLFRGLIQNLLARKTGRPVVALVLTSVFFGATHLNNTPAPDWRFFVLATVAGLFYGYNYMRARSLLGPALLHALVDSVWMLFLLNERPH